jgi:hypothetical protein
MSNKFSNNLKQKLKMKQLKIKSFLALFGLIMFANILAMGQTVVFSEDFASNTGSIPTGWIATDADGDGRNWYYADVNVTGVVGHDNQSGLMISHSWEFSDGPLTPDNWLITPQINLSASLNLKYFISSSSTNSIEFLAEHYGVYISTTGTNISDFTLLFEETISQFGWIERNIDLSAYSNQQVYIAWRHYNCTDKIKLKLDDISVSTANTLPSVMLEEGFENGFPSSWLRIDSDGDGYNWTTDKNEYLFNQNNTAFNAHSGDSAIGSGSIYLDENYSFLPLLPDNWLISPDITGADTMSYWIRSEIGGPSYDNERYGIFVSSTGRNISDFTRIVYDSTSGLHGGYVQRGVSLPAGTKYVAFRHYNTTDQGAIVLDDIKIMGTPPPTPPTVNMNRYIELTVTQGDTIRLSFKAEVENTGVMVKSGNDSTILSVGTSETLGKYRAGGSTMRIYGNVDIFICRKNGTKITGLDVSHNTGLTELQCDDNNISSLDLTGLTALKWLYCYYNNLSSLNLTGLTALKWLYCYENNLSSIITSGCISLREIYCDGNKLSACGLDSLFHQLPRRAEYDKGRIEHSYSTDGTSNPGSLSCRDTIATNRNWMVTDDGTPIANTTYACPYFTVGIEEVITDNISAKVYPNPVSNDLNIECGERIESLDIYDALGRKVISKENTPKSTTIDVSNLDNGIYILKLRTAKGSGEYKIVVND